MPTGPPTAPLVDALDLLERAVGYTRTSLALATDERMTNPTPCAGWDLRALLRHMDDSLAALEEAAALGYVDPEITRARDRDVVDSLRTRACALLGAWAGNDGADLVSVAGCPITAGMLVGTGALEIAVHGWDVARACGHPRPLPSGLAEQMLELAPLLVTDQDRPVRFASPVAVCEDAPPGDRLLAFLGRSP